MIDESINKKRIRDSAPYRKSLSMTENDIMRAAELERLFSTKFNSEGPFNFSKTISKSLELAILQMLHSEEPSGPVQQSLTGQAADQAALQARLQQRQQEPGQKQPMTSGKPKKFQKTKRGF